MEKQVRSVATASVAADSLVEIGENGCGVEAGFPVVAHRVPEDGREAEIAGGSQYIRTAGSVGRAEVADLCADGVFDRGVHGGELFADARWRLEEQHGVGEGVVADEVTGGVNAAGQLAALADEATDEEEGSADVVAGEEFEKLLSAGVVGPVVVGEGVFAGVASGEDGSAEDL